MGLTVLPDLVRLRGSVHGTAACRRRRRKRRAAGDRAMATFCRRTGDSLFLARRISGFLRTIAAQRAMAARAVKVHDGLRVLAAMLNMSASVDQVLQWNVFTRERFLAAWVVLFALAGL